MRECERQQMPAGEAFALGYGISMYEAAAEYLENHRHELVGAALRNESDGRQGDTPSPATTGVSA